jgi:hypothetical protein
MQMKILVIVVQDPSEAVQAYLDVYSATQKIASNAWAIKTEVTLWDVIADLEMLDDDVRAAGFVVDENCVVSNNFSHELIG